MKKIPFDQMIIGLDNLFFKDHYDVVKDADLIDAYIEGCGWDWGSILEYLSKEHLSLFDN
jgi:hypothetical protein